LVSARDPTLAVLGYCGQKSLTLFTRPVMHALYLNLKLNVNVNTYNFFEIKIPCLYNQSFWSLMREGVAEEMEIFSKAIESLFLYFVFNDFW
jgi:hypothetical protein